ncbi:hypothetical protein C5O00_09455 [Pukyongia salina]|uniref:DUF2071 domain-containing protein n=1 Tax=Pukyongia salina TaxID=2094025 RepID=A0A2S0HXH4_9FLAO|nr:DUF2071 domain-containing protein [Pukyongia salina]AVI51387.1 hypothetical protein C5O00_09455 [Pukyongia salina]
MSFLTAEWRKLLLVNYEIEPHLLKPYLPYKTELDTWNGIHYVSLVGFMFLNTKVFGLKFPFHINFEEINIRFYVRHHDGKNWRRGVVFIKELVPKPIISFIANTVYNEHYATRKMYHSWMEDADSLNIEYGFLEKGKNHSMQVNASKTATEIPPNSETEFITEHYWGYSSISGKKTTQYEVTHPRWLAYEVKDYKVDMDFGQVYGDRFIILNGLEPRSVMLAEGSSITVESKTILK